MSAAFLFDVDGTLIDSVDLHAEAWQRALAHFGVDVPFEAVRSQIGKGGDQLMPVFVPPAQLDRIGEALEKHRSALFQREYLPRVRPFPRVRDLFQRIREDRHHIVLASSASSKELEEFKKIAGIADLVDEETSSSDVDCSKPCPDVFEAAVAKVKVEPERTIVVGDTPYDVIAARRAGLRTVAVLCGGFPEQDLRTAGCVAVYRGPEDLLEHYDDLLALVTPALRTP